MTLLQVYKRKSDGQLVTIEPREQRDDGTTEYDVRWVSMRQPGQLIVVTESELSQRFTPIAGLTYDVKQMRERVEQLGRVAAGLDVTLEVALDKVLAEYGLPLYGYPLVTTLAGALQPSTSPDRGDRGDLASDLAVAVHRLQQTDSQNVVVNDVDAAVEWLVDEIGRAELLKRVLAGLDTIDRMSLLHEVDKLFAEKQAAMATLSVDADLRAAADSAEQLFVWRSTLSHTPPLDVKIIGAGGQGRLVEAICDGGQVKAGERFYIGDREWSLWKPLERLS